MLLSELTAGDDELGLANLEATGLDAPEDLAGQAPLEPLWQICPYCETPMQIQSAGAPPALGTRRAATTASRRRAR